MKNIEDISDWVILPVGLIVSVIIAFLLSFFMPPTDNLPSHYQIPDWHKLQ